MARLNSRLDTAKTKQNKTKQNKTKQQNNELEEQSKKIP